ncbi:MAG TPA: hypothetical protein VFM48_01680 [Aquabacterium sp.]|nr:hypothetical protein [Aquabacterium sp.]
MTTQARLIAALIALAIWGASMAACAWWFYGAGQAYEVAKQSEIKTAIEQTKEQARQGAADAIQKSQADSVKVVTQVRTITRNVPVYSSAECQHDDRVFDALNSALRGEPAGADRVPGGSGGAAGQVDGVDH